MAKISLRNRIKLCYLCVVSFLGTYLGDKEGFSILDMFVPYRVERELSCLSVQFAAVQVAYKEVLRWLGVSIRICDAIVKGNYEQRLMKIGMMRNVDRRKVSYLFKGWGDNELNQYKEAMDDICRMVSNERMLFWRKREKDF